MIHTGDAIEVMRTLPADSVDAVVTDPPYGLEFMNKTWDRLGVSDSSEKLPLPHFRKAGVEMQVWHQAWGTEALRVTKPGGYLLAFGGTRTHHRLVCGLEDAGWIIRDELTWVYASGFPKGKANLKPAHEPIVLARKPGPLRPLGIDAARIGIGDEERTVIDSRSGRGDSTEGWGHVGVRPDGERFTSNAAGRWPSNVLLSDPALFDEPNPEVVGSGATVNVRAAVESGAGAEPGLYEGNIGRKEPGEPYGGYGDSGGYSRFFLVPKSSRADREPVVRGQLAEGHAGVGIRAAEPGEYDDFVYPAPEGIGGWLREQREAAGLSAKALCGAVGAHGAVNHGGAVSNWEQELNRPTPDQWRNLRAVLGFDGRYDEVMTTVRSVDRKLMDGALPARRENTHATVKPVALMRHLIRLVTPSGGTVLDCFLGSGSTAIAAELEGFPWIGIEKEPEYVAIAEARLNGTQRGLGLDVPLVGKRGKRRPETYKGDTDRLEWRKDVTLGDPFTGLRKSPGSYLARRTLERIINAKQHRWSGWPGAYCLKCGLEDWDEADLSGGHRYSDVPHNPAGDCEGCVLTKSECRPA